MRWRVAAIVVLLLAACSDGARDDVLDTGGDTSIELSGVQEVAVVALGAGGFVVVDGAADHDDDYGTTVWLVRGGVVETIAELDEPALMPQGWEAADGSVHVAVMRCDGFLPDADHRCTKAPIEVLTIDPEVGSVEVADLNVTTSSDIGFNAVGGKESILITAYRNGPELSDDERGFMAYELTDDLASVTELGPVGMQLPCPARDGFVLFPRSLGEGAEGPRTAHAVIEGSLRPAGEVVAVDADVAEVTTCIADGAAQVQVIAGATVSDRVARFDGNTVLLEDSPVLPEPPESASLERAVDQDHGRWIAWVPTAGSDGYQTWMLHELAEDRWIELGSVGSFEQPQLTTFSGVETTAVVTVEDGKVDLVSVS